MKIKKFKIVRLNMIVFLATSLTLASCTSSYLDRDAVMDGLTLEEVITDSTNYWNLMRYMIVNPLFVHYHYNTSGNPFGSWDDFSDNSMSTYYGTNCPCVMSQAGDYMGLINLLASRSTYQEAYQSHWRHVRVANICITNIDAYPGSETTRNRILGTSYFFRGNAYMELTRRWGGMPYLEVPLTIDDEFDMVRPSMQETYLRAAEDFAKAAELLPNTLVPEEFQFPMRIAALAMRSRCLLYAASDQARTEDHETNPHRDLWEEAALAADYALKEAMATDYYCLAEWGDSDNGDDGYYYVFKGREYETILMKEVLWGRRAQLTWNLVAYMCNIRPPGTLQGTYGNAPNHRLVESFEMDNGLPITDSESGFNPQNPYQGRDRRFYHNIMYNQCQVAGQTLSIWNWNEETEASDAFDLRMDGADVQTGYTCTGTYMRKLMSKDWNAELFLCWPYIRLAEVYLNFAEAANEAWGAPDRQQGSCTYSAAGALNVVRNRALQPDIHEKFLTKDLFRERVRNERRVELCFEEHRFFDLRRWLNGTLPENRDIWSQRIVKLAPGYDENAYPTGFRFEEPEMYKRRIYDERHNLYPIRVPDTRHGNNFKQNPGW